MEENKILIGALIFFGLILGSNFVMYAIARGAARPGGGGLLDVIAKSLSANPAKKKDDMDELRRSVRELSEGGKESGKEQE